MNLLAKYKAMVQAPSTLPSISLVVDNISALTQKENYTTTFVQKGGLGEKPNSDKTLPPIIEGSTRVALEEIVAPLPTVKAGWSNPHEKGTPEARRESLHEAMSASFHEATKEGGGMPAGIRSCLVDLESIEKEIEARWRKVIEDNKGVKQFREYLQSAWTPALKEANKRLQEGQAYEREERYCLQNEDSLTDEGSGEFLPFH